MISEIEILNDTYIKWLKDKTVLRQVKDYVEITTPFLDRHNDYLQIYVKKEKNMYCLTDDGYTIQDLEISGCALDSPKRQNLLKTTLAGFGIENINSALTVKATTNNFALKKHNLIQAILAVNDLFYLAKSHINNLFLEDVTNWLDLMEIRYIPKVKFSGKTGYDHLFDFVIPKSKSASERILEVISNPTKDTAESMVFAWIDTKEVRPNDSQAYTILNDSDRNVNAGVIDAVQSYNITPVIWSKKEEAIESLAA